MQLSEEDRRNLERRKKAFQGEIAALRTQAADVIAQHAQLLRGCGLRPAPPPAVPASQPPQSLPEWDLARLTALVRQELEHASDSLEPIAQRPSYQACLLSGIIGRHRLLGVLPIFAAVIVVWIVPYPPALLPVLGIGVGMQLGALLYTAIRRWSIGRELRSKQQAISQLAARVGMLAESGSRELESGLPLHQHLARIDQDDQGERAQVLKSRCEQAIADVRVREQQLCDRVGKRYSRSLASLQEEAQQAQSARTRAEEARRSSLASAHQAQLAALDGRWSTIGEQLQERWRTCFRQLTAFGEAAMTESERLQPAWSDQAWSQWSPPTIASGELLIGRIRRPMAELLQDSGGKTFAVDAGLVLELPLCLALPQPASLLVRSGPACRDQALALINQLLLRALAAFPPASCA